MPCPCTCAARAGGRGRRRAGPSAARLVREQRGRATGGLAQRGPSPRVVLPSWLDRAGCREEPALPAHASSGRVTVDLRRRAVTRATVRTPRFRDAPGEFPRSGEGRLTVRSGVSV